MGPDAVSYQITEVVQDAPRWSLRRALRDGQPVLLKILVDGEGLDPRAIALLEHEFQIAAHLASTATLRPLALERIEGAPALVMENFPGVPLRRLMGPGLEP